jgi:hypothetical protein
MGRQVIPTTFFKEWTPQMAYVLGYWWADGCMHWDGRKYSIIFSSNDRDHLDLIAEVVGINHWVTGNKGCYSLVFSRKDMYEDLLQLGGVPRKSWSATWPDIPAYLWSHFVRGYIDGDGCFTWDRGVNPEIDIVGTEKLLVGMSKAVNQAIGIPIPRCRYHSKTWSIRWWGLHAKCIALWIYKDHNGLYLQRKGEIAVQFMDWWPNRYERNGVTPMMRELFGSHLPKL